MSIGQERNQIGISRRGFLATAAVAAGTVLAGCSGSGGGSSQAKPVSAADRAAALKKPAEITFWSWVPNIQQQVAMFRNKYPNIKVNLVNAGQGLDEYTKLRTALKAGKGAPDVVQIEYSYLPTFTITDDLLDLGGYGANDLKGDYVDWTWKQVSVGDKVYAIPQDTGPLGMLYRKDVFDRYGLSIPKTWEEFAAQGRKLHSANPAISMTNFANNDAGQTFGYAWQAGARPFKVDGAKISISMNSPEMKKLAGFWSPLVASGVVSADADFNNDWYAGLTNGSYATWITAAWAPIFLTGSAAKSAGKWRVAPMPQWSDGASASGNWGGSTSAVTKQTKYPEAAAAFAMFLNHDPESSLALATKQSLYPPLKTTLENPQFRGQALPFFGGQKVNELFAGISETVATDFQWSPFNDYVTSTNNQILGGALTKKTDLSAALDSWQDNLAGYAKKQGFTVES
jgi:multiple sugar transport system substrate-binding protein